MKSHHEGFTKHFLKIPLKSETDSLTKLILDTLHGNSPHFPLHLTLSTIHIKGIDGLTKLQKMIDEWKPDLPSHIESNGAPWYQLMGKTHIKFIALVFTCHVDFVLLRVQLCDWLALRLGVDYKLINVNENIEMEIIHDDMIIRIPFSSAGDENVTNFVYHVSLFSTNDLKKFNKLLYDEYCEEPKTFITKLISHESIRLKIDRLVLQ